MALVAVNMRITNKVDFMNHFQWIIQNEYPFFNCGCMKWKYSSKIQ